MAKVYLPYGYPLIAGAAHQAVVYQGTMVRLYVDTPDPRTSAQMENRYLFADVRRMIKTAGERAKALLKVYFGTRYTSNVYAYIRADEEGWWQYFVDEYNALQESTKESIRGMAPYAPTWNDVGKIWWAVYKTVANYADSYGRYTFGIIEAVNAGIPQMADWWTGQMVDYLGEGVWDSDEELITCNAGSWTTVAGTNDIGGYHREIGSNGVDWYEFTFYGRRAMIGFRSKTTLHDIDVEIDNEPIEVMRQTRESEMPRRQWCTPLLAKGFHHVRVRANVNMKSTLDYVVIFKGTSLINKVGVEDIWKYNYSRIYPLSINSDTYLCDGTYADNILCIGGCNDIAE